MHLPLPWKGAAHNVCWTMLSREVIAEEVCLGPICLLLLSTRWRKRKQPEEASLSVRIEGPLWRGEIQNYTGEALPAPHLLSPEFFYR
ncbi:hypothetical protein LEMLEM_LOCUS13119, partial [Lemmus lemmus]